MTTTFQMTFKGELPDDEIDAASLKAGLKEPRDAFVAALTEKGFKHVHETKTVKEKAKSATPRKRKTASVPAVGATPSGEIGKTA